MITILGRLRALRRVLWHSQQLESEMREEMQFHLEMEAERLAREEKLAPPEARRRAHVRFGGVEKYKSAGRDARGRSWIDAIALDSRLGARMLVKYKGLTLIGGFAMAVAIAIGATAFETLGETLTPGLPFEGGDRVVSLQQTASNPGTGERGLLADFAVLDEELTSIEDLGAFRTIQRNLVSPHAPPEPIKLAEMTASGFAIARTQPLLGRYLLRADEEADAAPVVVIGYDAWQARFAADPEIVGRTIALGAIAHTIVGVMPDGFGFPFDHQFWLPFRANPLASERLTGPTIYVFGRLAPGVSIEQAQAEWATKQPAPSADRSDPGEAPQAAVVPYTRDHVDLSSPGVVWLLRVGQLLTGALVFVVAVNLAILFYARTVTRLGEIAIRTALGASRRRILAQLFVEAMALSLLGAASGLGLAAIALEYIQSLARSAGGVPYWIRFELSPVTALEALGLAIVAAIIMGVLPGLKATGRDLNARLHELNGRTGKRLGALWTTLVVAQVAAAVAVLPVAFYVTWLVLQLEVSGPGFAAEKFAISLVALPDDAVPVDSSRVRERQLALMSRLGAEPGAVAVTYSSYVPGFAGGARIQFADRVAVNAPEPWDVSRLDVAPDMLDIYGAEMLAGRRFTPGDVGAAHSVVVNETFAQWLSGNDNALGVRFRYVESSGRSLDDGAWYEIVGVARDFPRFPPAFNFDTPAVVYHAAAVGTVNPAILSVQFDHDVPAGFGVRVRHIAAGIDPALQVRRALPLSAHYDQLRAFWRYVSWGVALVTVSVLLLSAAGMYALMSCTVAQRTREIGIRVALGAQPGRLLVSVFGRVLRQVAVGIAAGSLASTLVMSMADLNPSIATWILLAVATIMLTVGVLAAVGPARRSLSIHAAEALRTDP